MSSKAQKRQRAEAATSRKKVRKVVIDSDEDDEQTVADDQQHSLQGNEHPDGDEVVAEVDVYLLPLHPSGSTGSGTLVSVNRLQFPQQQTHLLRRRFSNNYKQIESDADDDISSTKCFAQYKAQVKHLRLGFMPKNEGMPIKMCSSTSFGGGGIAELLTKSNVTASTSTQLIASSPSSTHSRAQTAEDVFAGEGYSQHDMFSHAVGFFQGGRLFLLPVDKTYEMRKPLTGAIEREAAKTAQKALKSTSASQTVASTAPLRIRFARPESDLQRRRREQSAIYKQKIVEQDQWISLGVNQTSLAEMYGKNISEASLLGPFPSTAAAHSSATPGPTLTTRVHRSGC